MNAVPDVPRPLPLAVASRQPPRLRSPFLVLRSPCVS